MAFIDSATFHECHRNIFRWVSDVGTQVRQAHNGIINDLQNRPTLETLRESFRVPTAMLQEIQNDVSAQTSLISNSVINTLQTVTQALEQIVAPTSNIAERTFTRFIPPTQVPMPELQLDINTLAGSVQSAHMNLLEWIMHNARAIDQLQNTIQNLSIGTRNVVITAQNQINQKLDNDKSTLIEKVDSLQHLLHELKQEANQQFNGQALEDIQSKLEAIRLFITSEIPTNHGQLINLLHELQGNQASTPAQNNLALYEAQHPTINPRTHGRLELDESYIRIPMDVLQRPPSTTLNLKIEVHPKQTKTEVRYTLHDEFELVFIKSLSTPYRMEELPDDALSLLHCHCPRFIYKLTQNNLC
ncbi:serine-rich 40 kDa protein [Vanilla latent virus]|uniref:Serine-rich 40 kDa protein n=1 Tax=Vanilla latent virus TaxID=2016426 RepID=A0A220NQ57_9VIRU|nr:serine-rich 40 kDa protein [Vanilla latent virus]ASJ78781.1 serine-rich 40 kDa protein [Vanilla latent virus]